METKSVTTKEQRGPAVLILAYNRVDEFRQTLQTVVQQDPASIYVSVDGPKFRSKEDEGNVSAVQEAVLEFQESHAISARFAETNGGVLDGVLGGIDWFFSHEKRGIVLEDDVVIAPNSLGLASSLLEKLEPRTHIGSVSLFNPVPNKELAHPGDAIRLSTMPSSQYWGTWSDRWKATYQFREKSPTAQSRITTAVEAIPDRRLRQFWARHLSGSGEGWTCWEDLWILTHWALDWTATYTNGNFSRHIGFNQRATNSWDRPSWYPTHFDKVPVLATPDLLLQPDSKADAWYFNQRFGLSPWKRIKHSLWSRFPIMREFYLRALRPPAERQRQF